MKRPTRAVKRESVLTYRGRAIIVVLPPDAATIMVREKGRRTSFEVDVLSVFYLAARKAAEALKDKRRTRRRVKSLKLF